MIRVAIVGGTGYTGVELLRILSRHPGVELAAITSRAEAGRPVGDVFPSLRGAVDLSYSDPGEPGVLDGCDLVFYAAPNGVAMRHAPALLDAGAKVIDLSADFRIKDPVLWRRWYGEDHACPELLDTAVYGLSEFHRAEIAQADLVANPGCYPTAIQIGFVPLLEQSLVDASSLVADAKSGVSGAGRKEAMATQYCEASDSLKAYAVPGHRHLPEIAQQLRGACGGRVGLTFVPHLTPMIRGLYATLYARLREPETDLQAVFESRYADEPFIDVLPAESHPDTRSVRGTNVCRIAVHRPGGGDMAVILVVADNLVKGAAGQAIQNMNIMTGLDETTGLSGAALLP